MVTIIFQMTFGVYISYNHSFGVVEFFVVLVLALISFMLILAIKASIELAQSLYKKMDTTNIQNMKLLDDMNVGLIILRKDEAVENTQFLT